MVNYDLPWNPNRLEQRFGRIHRIGQTEVCHLWNLVAEETREGDVYRTLLDKLEQARQALGGQVFDVLGKLQFEGRPLRDLLLEAIRYGERPEVRARLTQAIANAVDRPQLQALLEERALAHDAMDASRVARGARGDGTRRGPPAATALYRVVLPRSLQAARGTAASASRAAMRSLMSQRPSATATASSASANPCCRATSASPSRKPSSRRRASPWRPSSARPPAAGRHARPDARTPPRSPAPRHGAGGRARSWHAPRVLFYLEHALQDASSTRSGERRTISQQLLYVELDATGQAYHLHYAPYLDYRPLRPNELDVDRLLSHPACAWITRDLEQKAVAHAIAQVVPQHLQEVRGRRLGWIDKTRAAVKDRLTKEIGYWDHRAEELKLQEQAGRTNARLNSQEARRRADELQARLKRMEQLDLEAQISALPPVALGGLVVVLPGSWRR